jgi:hypothetical protein
MYMPFKLPAEFLYKAENVDAQILQFFRNFWARKCM